MLARTLGNIIKAGDWKLDASKKSTVKLYVADVHDSCVACNAKHQLHTCRDFCTMFHEQKMAIVKKNALAVHEFFEARHRTAM